MRCLRCATQRSDGTAGAWHFRERSYQNSWTARDAVDPAPYSVQPHGWPPDVFTEKLVRSRMLGRTNYFVTDPEPVGRVLVDDADKLVRVEPMRRALEPAFGQSILTAEGARWRGQRRTASPVFRAQPG